ncbi:MAG: diguanylate phosphodiesterase [Desulfuromonas sp.]|nr:MAG: diguanylate phosphodiesterase [Desulfuromonas sp.]
MTDNENDKGKANRGDEFLQIFKKGAEFTQELLKENERLRFEILKIQEDTKPDETTGGSMDEVAQLRARVESLEKEKEEVLDRIRLVEEENQDFANRYIDVESENNMLANLYIASYQLHSTLDHQEVLQIISEIVINLIGAEEFAVLLVDEKSHDLQTVATEGVDQATFPVVQVGEGVIGQAAQSGENYYVDNLAEYTKDLESPMVCIPLKIKDHVIGVLVLYHLLEQKEQFADVDFELFTLLAGHAATAIFSSKLYSESERKLSTIQGFINLMTK